MPVNEILQESVSDHGAGEADFFEDLMNDQPENGVDQTVHLTEIGVDQTVDLSQQNVEQRDGLLEDDLNLSSISNILSPSLSLSDLMVSPEPTPCPSTSAITLSSEVNKPTTTTISPKSTSSNFRTNIPGPALNKPSAIQISPKSLASIFDDVIRWPEAKVGKSTMRKKQEYVPVITSDKYIEYLTLKDEEKKEKERQQNKRKLKRELSRKQKEACKALKEACEGATKKKVQKLRLKSTEQNDRSSDDEWIESGDSLDDVELGVLEDPEEVELSEADNLKVGDFVLAKFCLAGKKSLRVTEYKYAAVILTILPNFEFSIQCLKSVDSGKTKFKLIDNDVSQINIKDIIGKLPDLTVKEEGRVILNEFPGAVRTVEKH